MLEVDSHFSRNRGWLFFKKASYNTFSIDQYELKVIDANAARMSGSLLNEEED